MIGPSLARPGPESSDDFEHIGEVVTRAVPVPGYALRGFGLFELHRDEIIAGYQGGGRWLIPSGTVSGRLYEVRAGCRPERSRCECRGFVSHGHCSHIVVATEARRRSAICDGCGKRFPHRDLVEVQEDHESLTLTRA